MDSCYHPKVCNCVNDSNCSKPPGHECCSENPPKGKPKFGMWVKEGTCDKKTGLCASRGKSLPGHKESFTIFTREGYDDEKHCRGWKSAFWLLWILLFFSLLSIVFFMVKKGV